MCISGPSKAVRAADELSMSIEQNVDNVRKLLDSNAQGDAYAHRMLLEAVHRLQLAVETPFDTAMRQRWQVSPSITQCSTTMQT